MNELGPVPEDVPGEREATVDGTTFRLGDTVMLRLGDAPIPTTASSTAAAQRSSGSSSTTTTSCTSASRWTTTPGSS